MPLHVSSTCAHHQEVKIALHSLWYNHTETSEWSKITKITNFDVLLTEHLSIFISVINQLDAQKFCFTISLFHAATCFEHHVLIIRRSKLHYTPIGVTIPEAV